MPVLILTITVNLDKLLEDCRLASETALSKLCRVMVMAVDLPLMLVVAILRSKYGWTHRAREVVHVVLLVEGGNVRTTKRRITLAT